MNLGKSATRSLGAVTAIDTVTILLVAPGKLASKQFHKASPTSQVSKRDYDAGYLFNVFPPVPVNGIAELSEVLQAVEGCPQALIVRGAPIAQDLIGTWVERRGCGHGTDFVGNFQTPPCGRWYAMIDIDKFALPKGWKLNRRSVRKVCEYLVHQLPTEFHNASYHWQLSSSAGVGDASTVSMHLWFWLSRPVSDADLKAWAKHVNTFAGKKLVDDALFQHVQAHYTAAPVFTGMVDPFPCRSGLVQKRFDSVTLELPEPTLSVMHTGDASTRPIYCQDGSGFEFHLGQIGDHPGGSGFHSAVIRAAASYVGTHGAERTDIEEVYGMIRDHVLAADASQHDAAYIARMASREHIIPAITSALPRFGKSDRPRKSRLHADLAPHYVAETVSVEQAQREFKAHVAKLFG